MDQRPPLYLILPGILFLFITSSCFQTSRFEKGEERAHIRISDDLYLVGNELSITEEVGGDLIAAGGKLKIMDSVSNDVWIASGDVELNAPVGDDVRIFSGRADINSDVYGDVLIFGGRAIISEGITVHGEVYTYTSDVTIDGRVNGPVVIKSGSLSINGELGSRLEIAAADVYINGKISGDTRILSKKLEIGPDAIFSGSVRYWTETGEVDFGSSMEYGAAIFDEKLKEEISRGPKMRFLGMGGMIFMIWITLAMFLVILVLNWLFPLTFAMAGETLRDNLPRSLLTGLAFIIGLPIIAGFIFTSLVGIPLSLILFGTYGILMFAGRAIAALVFAQWARVNFDKRWGTSGVLVVSLAIFFLMRLIGFIPIIGWIASMIFIACGLGAFIADYSRRRKKRLQT